MTIDALCETDAFLCSDTAQPHLGRTRAILRAHPEVRDLLGPAPSTFLLLLALVGAQTAVALALSEAPVWLLVLVAYTVGAVINCAVLNMVHEACHGLIFRSRRWNIFAAFVANLGSMWPQVETFFRYHLPHHLYLGDYDRDATIPRDWEARLIGRSWVLKILWLIFFAFLYPFRVVGMQVGPARRSWAAINVTLQLLWLSLLYALGGWQPILYLFFSFYFHFGLHPLNAIALQEHLFVRRGQESYSYYGIGNWITFNAGYHVEHHDFPYIAWSRIRRLRALAPEYYEQSHSYESWSGLMADFVRDRRWSLWARVVRARADGPERQAHGT